MLDSSEELVAERDEDIRKIGTLLRARATRSCVNLICGRAAQSIEELSEIFKELAVLVIDQGTILDRIDFNMEQVWRFGYGGLARV